MIKFDTQQLEFLKKSLRDQSVSEIYEGAKVLKQIDLYQAMYEQYRILANNEIQDRVKNGKILMATSI